MDKGDRNYEEKIDLLTIKPPVSVCHHVSEIGHLESPTTLKNHLEGRSLKVNESYCNHHKL